jgi:hypothetical protein
MSAAEALKAARAAGVQLGADGTGRRDYSWSAEDWRVFFDERAGIDECDGGSPHAEAEAQAFACCVVAWNAPTVRANPLKSYTGTAAGGADANLPPQSALEKTGAPGWSERP